MAPSKEQMLAARNLIGSTIEDFDRHMRGGSGGSHEPQPSSILRVLEQLKEAEQGIDSALKKIIASHISRFDDNADILFSPSPSPSLSFSFPVQPPSPKHDESRPAKKYINGTTRSAVLKENHRRANERHRSPSPYVISTRNEYYDDIASPVVEHAPSPAFTSLSAVRRLGSESPTFPPYPGGQVEHLFSHSSLPPTPIEGSFPSFSSSSPPPPEPEPEPEQIHLPYRNPEPLWDALAGAEAVHDLVERHMGLPTRVELKEAIAEFDTLAARVKEALARAGEEVVREHQTRRIRRDARRVEKERKRSFT